MSDDTVAATAAPMSIDRRLFIASGSAGIVFAALHAAIAHAAPIVAGGGDVFDPAAYVDLWERYGNIVYFDVSRAGKEFFAIYFPDNAEFPPSEELHRFDAVRENKAECTRKLVAYLKARGQKAGEPLNKEAF